VAISYRGSGAGKRRFDQLQEEVAASGAVPPVGVIFDVRSPDQVRRGIDEAADRLGGVDILINAAGVNTLQPALEVDESTWDSLSDTNAKGLFFCCQSAARRMLDQGPRTKSTYSIVNISSQMGLVGYRLRAAYCASKAAVCNLTRVLAIEWASIGIRVNCIAPGFISTPLEDPILSAGGFREEVIERIPQRRIGQPADVAGCVLYLCGAGAEFVTGSVVSVDGGWTAW
jgi:2-deoxy-D-gluconate 3-dehydrogenase